MKTEVYVVLSRRGIQAFRKSAPSLSPGERAFRLKVEVPDSAFTDAAIPTVEIFVPAPALSLPPARIAAEVVWPAGVEEEELIEARVSQEEAG